MNSNWSYSPETSSLGQNQHFLPLWPWNLTDDLKNNRALLLTYFKLCASFRSHWWIKTGVTVRKHPIWVKISDFFLSLVTLKFDRWPWNTIEQLFYATSSYVHHFKAICEIKLELWSRNTQIGAKFALTSVTLTFDLWPSSFFFILHGHHVCQW